jgi:ribokinase
MHRPVRIVVVGSLVFDFVAKAQRLPRKGETILGDAFGMFPGGKGANQAVQAGRLGADVFLVGRVGDDFLADRLFASLQASGVHTDFVRRDRSVNTAACCIHVDAEGNNTIVIVPEANRACCPEDVDAAGDVLDSADVILCQLEIPLSTVVHAAQRAARHNVPVILNPAPAQPVPATIFQHVTILTPNETEAEQLLGRDTSAAAAGGEAQMAKRLLALGPQTIIITLGERGAFLARPETEVLVPAYRVAVVDGTAAGDAFNGALAVALAEQRPIHEAIAFANAAGALATTRVGAQPSLASRGEVEALFRGAHSSNLGP